LDLVENRLELQSTSHDVEQEWEKEVGDIVIELSELLYSESVRVFSHGFALY
jgi:hypothetical protein